MADNPFEPSVARFDDAFERVDRQVARVESGAMTFALLAMSLTTFLKIVFEAVIADRNFVDSFLLRWLHGTDTQPPAALLAQVKGVYSPTIVVVVSLLVGVGAARTIATQIAAKNTGPAVPTRPPWRALDLGLGLAIAGGFGLLGWMVVAVPSMIMCAGLYLLALALFARRAHRHGDLRRFLATWAVLSIPIGVLISRIPTQYAWVNDLSKMLIMYVGFLGASMASRDRKHIVLNFGRRLWPRGIKRLVEAFSLLIWLLFDLLLLVLAGHLMQLQIEAGATLSILPVAEYNIVLPVVLSFALMSARVAADLVRVVAGATPKAPEAPSPKNSQKSSKSGLVAPADAEVSA